jgi:protein-S-isoprenylcysteine O-methyltransferase Ste14
VADASPEYNLWWLVAANSIVFTVFFFSFIQPKSKTDWRAFGGMTAFIVALFTEMYGFPLTVYLLSGYLGGTFPTLNLLTHDSGHLWHLNPIHLASNVIIASGFIVLFLAWQRLFDAQARHQLATGGIYARVRHPQYVGFILIMLGFLVQWPTLPTLVMFPILLVMYVRLAKREEQQMIAEFGEAYREYARRVPAFIPRLIRVPAEP